MADVGLNDFARTVGANNGNVLKDIAAATSSAVCGYYRQTPANAIDPSGILDGPGYQFARGLFDSLCSPDPGGLPASPPDGNSHQCPGLYGVCIAFDNYVWNGTTFVFDQRYEVCRNLNGPLGGIVLEKYIRSQDGIQFVRVGLRDGQTHQIVAFSEGQASQYDYRNPAITVVNYYGGADDCGQDVPRYVPTSIPPDSVTKPTISIPRASGGSNWNIPIVITPGVSLTGIAPTININAQINANVSVPVAISFGGISFNLGDSSGSGLTPEQISQIINNSSSAATNSAAANTAANTAASNANDAKNAANNAAVNAKKAADNTQKKVPPSPANHNSVRKSDNAPPADVTDSSLEWVEILLDTVPLNVKNQSGYPSPNIVYAGWFEFRSNGDNLPRQPIHFARNIFPVPGGIDGYAYTLYSGIVGHAVEYYRKTTDTTP